jgi:hypothetical protein
MNQRDISTAIASVAIGSIYGAAYALTIAACFKTSNADGRHIIAEQSGAGMHDSFMMWYESGSAFMFQLEDTAGNPHRRSSKHWRLCTMNATGGSGV